MLVNNPISIQGQITRAQDFSTIKQNEDNRGAVAQLNITRSMDDQNENKAKQVQQKEDMENSNQRHDAKEKGSNQYFGDGGKSRNGRGRKDGIIIRKSPYNTEITGIDIKV
ncbi:MAG: hypothetical protein LBC96_06425 [Lachnospiraceae bacterium]|jgi:hypothetical protein|nr:hypothetical protein [Lachnospiraceae bacterium]